MDIDWSRVTEGTMGAVIATVIVGVVMWLFRRRLRLRPGWDLGIRCARRCRGFLMDAVHWRSDYELGREYGLRLIQLWTLRVLLDTHAGKTNHRDGIFHLVRNLEKTVTEPGFTLGWLHGQQRISK